MSHIYSNLTETIGNTPMVRLQNFSPDSPGHILAKLEYFNPASSVKDRIALAIIEAAEKSGELKQGGTIVEATSGNTGIGLAMVGAVKGYKVILTMPETMSVERRKLLRILGAELVLTPGKQGMQGAVDKAEELVKNASNTILARQFENAANPDIHRKTTAEEIWRDSAGKVDILVAGVGTGGTLTGVGEVLKSYRPELKVIAVEPEESPLLREGKPGPHKLQGLGTNFMPKVLNSDIIDEIIGVTFTEAIANAKKVARTEGILGGISAGAALAAASQVANRKENLNKNIVVIIPDTGERYLSTALFDDFKD